MRLEQASKTSHGGEAVSDDFENQKYIFGDVGDDEAVVLQ